VNSDLAFGLFYVCWKLKGHGDGPAALRVLNGRATFGTSGGLLAYVAVFITIYQVEFGVY
jgi:hypothetical protein